MKRRARVVREVAKLVAEDDAKFHQYQQILEGKRDYSQIDKFIENDLLYQYGHDLYTNDFGAFTFYHVYNYISVLYNLLILFPTLIYDPSSPYLPLFDLWYLRFLCIEGQWMVVIRLFLVAFDCFCIAMSIYADRTFQPDALIPAIFRVKVLFVLASVHIVATLFDCIFFGFRWHTAMVHAKSDFMVNIILHLTGNTLWNNGFAVNFVHICIILIQMVLSFFFLFFYHSNVVICNSESYMLAAANDPNVFQDREPQLLKIQAS